MTSMACRRVSITLAAAVLLFGFSSTAHAQKYVKGERPQTRGYSLAVITEGGKTVWLGGQIAGAVSSKAPTGVESVASAAMIASVFSSQYVSTSIILGISSGMCSS